MALLAYDTTNPPLLRASILAAKPPESRLAGKERGPFIHPGWLSTRCGSFRLPWAILFNGFAVPPLLAYAEKISVPRVQILNIRHA